MIESIIYSGVKQHETIAPLGVVKEFKKGSFVFKEKANAVKLYKLKEGILALSASIDEDKPIFSHFVHAGEYFGAEAIMNFEQRNNSAQVLSDKVKVEEYSVNSLFDHSSFLSTVKADFIVHSHRMQHTLIRNASLNLKKRLCAVLALIGDACGVKLLNGEVLIRTHLKHRELAFICNATRQSVTTELIKLNIQNDVNIDKNSILLTNQLLTNT